MKTQLWGPINLTFTTWCVNSKKPLKLVCLGLMWLGINEHSFCGQKKYHRNTRCQHQKAVETSVFDIVWLGTTKHSFRDQKNITFATRGVNTKKPLKLVCLALVWLGANKHSFCDQKKVYLRNTMCQHQKAVETIFFDIARLGTYKMQPRNPNAHTYVNGTDVEAYGNAVMQNTFLKQFVKTVLYI